MNDHADSAVRKVRLFPSRKFIGGRAVAKMIQYSPNISIASPAPTDHRAPIRPPVERQKKKKRGLKKSKINKSLPKIPAARVDVRQAKDGRWIAESSEFPGMLSYGATAMDAVKAARELAESIPRMERIP